MKYNFFNQELFDVINPSSQRILDVGCDTGLLGAALKKDHPTRYVAGIEINAETALQAECVLDQVYNIDVEKDDLTGVGSNYDAIIMGDIIEHLYDPKGLLNKLSVLLSGSGKLYLCIPNIQHYSILRKLFKGDFQYKPIGLLDETHIRFFCLSNIQKLLLDSGYFPKIKHRVITQDKLLEKLAFNIVDTLGYSRGNLLNMRTFQYIVSATKINMPTQPELVPLTFVVIARNKHLLRDNFLSSPIFKNEHPHQILVEAENVSAAQGLNKGFGKAINDYVVFVREEVYLPQNWDVKLSSYLADLKHGLPGGCSSNWVAGIHGVSMDNEKVNSIGRYIDRNYTVNNVNRKTDEIDPYQVDALLDPVLIAPKKCSQRFDHDLGFHLHATDYSMNINNMGGRSYVFDLPCLFNEQRYKSRDKNYESSFRILLDRWPDASQDLLQRLREPENF